MYSFLSAMLGAILAIMIYMNGALANSIGNSASSSFAHLSGLILVILILLLTRSQSPFQKGLSPLQLSGGIFGTLTVIFSNISFLNLGVALTLAIGLLGQTISALVIDHFGFLGATVVKFNRRKLASLGLISLGVAIMAYA